jgi:hypothetical protein
MQKTFTLENLIQFSYNETGDQESLEIIEALNENEEFLDEYLSLQDVKDSLDSIQEDPSENTIRNILNYSKALNVFNFRSSAEPGLVIVN